MAGRDLSQHIKRMCDTNRRQIMSVEYNVSQDGLRIETFPKGILNTEETVNYFERLKNDKNIKQGAIEIVYFRHVTNFKISSSEIERLTQKYQEPKERQMMKATIFVCETDLAYGIGRMLQVFHKIANPKHKVVLVRSESEIENVI
jgi:hypothetical protein